MHAAGNREKRAGSIRVFGANAIAFSCTFRRGRREPFPVLSNVALH